MLKIDLPIELLVSILNTYLRSKYSNLFDLCEYENLCIVELTDKLAKYDYSYNETLNQIKNIVKYLHILYLINYKTQLKSM